jgi:hypothetical protein
MAPATFLILKSFPIDIEERLGVIPKRKILTVALTGAFSRSAIKI